MSISLKLVTATALLALAGCAGSSPNVATGRAPPFAIGFNNQLVTGQSPAGTWDTGGSMQAFEPPNSLPR